MGRGSENPYEVCPVYETEKFTLRLVRLDDAQDLLECYSDPKSAKIFNSDNCTSDFIYQTCAEMQNCIGFWLDDYARRGYVRFSIVDKTRNKAVGTIEFFAKTENFPDYGTVGLLRLDLPSKYETGSAIAEILGLVDSHFYECFAVNSIVTKAVPEAVERIAVLKKSGYQALENNTIVPYGDYYVKTR
jgi:RimJ/RimL family protein N-acetyltransferase